MKSIFRLGIVAIVSALWLSLIQPTQASNLHGLQVLDAMGLSPQAVPIALQKTVLASPQGIFIASTSAMSNSETRDGFSVASQLDDSPFYRAVVSNPMNASAWNNLGSQLFSLNLYTEALFAYNHALLIDADYSLGLANRCGVLSKLGQYAQALDSCQLAIEINRHWGSQGAALAWDNQGDVLFNLQRYSEAIKSFEQALTLNPDDLNARRNWAISQHQLDQLSQHSTLE